MEILLTNESKTSATTKTPGVEDIEPRVCTDEHGLTLTELAPWGVIGAITPVTNPIATITSNAIGMIAAGNSVVFNVHPNAKKISCRLISMLNDAIHNEGGPSNLLCALREPTIESASVLMRHKGIALLVVTGGPGVVKAAMESGKKAICAGPGNPPCVVDSTADIVKAGRDIVLGASFDNNVVCICEKEVLAVASIADRLKEEMRKNSAFELTGNQIDAVTKLVIAEPGGPDHEGAPNKAYVGKSAPEIARAAGIEVPPETKLLLMEVMREHPLVWTEQLMPVLPLVRMKDVDEAIDFAIVVERGCRHTAMMHSHDIEKLSRMAKVMNCSLFVKNGPCYAGLGQGGAGYASLTIASPTGEGITAHTFTRKRRCTLVDYLESYRDRRIETWTRGWQSGQHKENALYRRSKASTCSASRSSPTECRADCRLRYSEGGREILSFESGKEAAQANPNGWFNPADAAIIGIVDAMNTEETR